MPKISILVPIYNVEKYLKECLDSILSQTLQDIEIICINDGSTDSSLEIIKEYSAKDNRIKIIDKQNSGYGASMNRGLAIATGEYIGVVESDDFIKNVMFERLYNIAKKHNADVVKSDYLLYTTATNKTRKAGKISKFFANRILDAKKYPRLLKMPPSIWSAIYKRRFLEENQIRFLETPGASYQDTSFSFKIMALAEKVVLTDKAYLYYRQDNENSSVHSKEKVFIICEEYDEITKFLNANPSIKEFANTPKLMKQYATYLWNLKRIDEKFRDDFIEVFSNTFKTFYDANELTGRFYLKFGKKQVETLVNNKKAFKAVSNKIIKKGDANANRQKLFSVRINSSRVSIVLFGKQIVEIG